jgi:hypothetical protein
VKFIKRAEKNFFTHSVQADCEWSKRQFLTQKDRKRHRQSDKNRPATKRRTELTSRTMCGKGALNAGRPGHF